MIRIQLGLDEAVHSLLRDAARRQEKTISKLVNEALDRVYGTGMLCRRARSLRDIAGLWHRDDLGDTRDLVRRLRGDSHRTRH
jgi:hypothetical protein